MTVPHRPLCALLGMTLPLAFLAGCEGWPRYLHLDDDPGEFVITDRVVVFEDESLDGEELQLAGDVATGTEILYYGFLTTCGYDDDATWPEWPLHDLDADGTPESPLHSGWYDGDVDWLGLTVVGEVTLEGSLEWAERPTGDTNAPYEPGDPTGAWSTESDLDLVVFTATGGERTIVEESAISNDYPEVLSPETQLTDGTVVAVAVACHHALPTDFELRLVVH